jgi:hypothetical protein
MFENAFVAADESLTVLRGEYRIGVHRSSAGAEMTEIGPARDLNGERQESST